MKRQWLVGLVGLGLASVAGCGGISAAKVDEAKGHVRKGLEAWKAGGKPDDLKTSSPAVEFNEQLWIAGEKLVNFELTGTARYVDAVQAVRVEAKLTLRGKKGKDRTETVTYDVTLGPPVKVVNNPMP